MDWMMQATEVVNLFAALVLLPMVRVLGKRLDVIEEKMGITKSERKGKARLKTVDNGAKDKEAGKVSFLALGMVVLFFSLMISQIVVSACAHRSTDGKTITVGWTGKQGTLECHWHDKVETVSDAGTSDK